MTEKNAHIEARERQLWDREAKLALRELHVKELEERLNELEDMEHRYLRRVAPEVSWAHKEAVGNERDAIRSMEAVEEACGHALKNARCLLEGPCAKSAASALMDLAKVAKSCNNEALGAVKAAERAVRGVVVLRCRSQAKPADRGALLEAAEEAFGRPLDRELRAASSARVPQDRQTQA